jgi:hypothetical protein
MLTKEQYDELVGKINKDTADKIKSDFEAAEKKINGLVEEASKGMLKAADFEKYKSEEIGKINERLKEVEKMETAVKDMGTKMTEIETHTSKSAKNFEEWVIEQAPTIKELKNSGKFVEITAKQLKAAGIQSIGNTINGMDTPPTSPYAPGIGGETLQIFDILRNPRFILNHVDLGRTNQSRLAWANEVDYQGAPAEVDEGQQKPFVQHKFKVEMSTAKKIAGVVQITEEFEDDLPQFATQVRRMLQEDVLRGWDDAIFAAVKAVATQYGGGVGLNGMIDKANNWDALLAMAAQVQVNNFPNVNTYGLHPFTNVATQTSKSTLDYWNPPFKDEILRALAIGNKMDPNYALVGDLTQYKVDIYKDFVLKMGWINDDFIRNQFCIVGEMRYHRYISDARKKAIVYDLLSKIKTSLDSASS